MERHHEAGACDHDVILRSNCPNEAMTEKVNHPTHYNKHPSGIECIQIVRHFNFNVGNAIKYLWRAGIKGRKTHIEDLRKAEFYIKDEIARLTHGKTTKD